MNYLVVLGRVLYALIFVVAGPGHFAANTIAYAASQGVPLAWVAVPLSGIMAFAGGLSIALGFRAKWGGWLIVLFLVPVTVMMHNFWAMTDPNMAQMQQIMFMKNLSMLGAALLIAHFGSGPLSLDSRK
jgi:putative oxidoreductase